METASIETAALPGRIRKTPAAWTTLPHWRDDAALRAGFSWDRMRSTLAFSDTSTLGAGA